MSAHLLTAFALSVDAFAVVGVLLRLWFVVVLLGTAAVMVETWWAGRRVQRANRHAGRRVGR